MPPKIELGGRNEFEHWNKFCSQRLKLQESTAWVASTRSSYCKLPEFMATTLGIAWIAARPEFRIVLVVCNCCVVPVKVLGKFLETPFYISEDSLVFLACCVQGWALLRVSTKVEQEGWIVTQDWANDTTTLLGTTLKTIITLWHDYIFNNASISIS